MFTLYHCKTLVVLSAIRHLGVLRDEMGVEWIERLTDMTHTTYAYTDVRP